MKLLLSATLMLILTFSTSSFGIEFMPEISPEARKIAATKVVKAPNTVAVYARGLCCASCAIGIRKKLVKIDVIDLTRFNQGIELDPKTQLVHIALKPGTRLPHKAVAQAILDAGYDAVQVYSMKKGQLHVALLAEPKKDA